MIEADTIQLVISAAGLVLTVAIVFGGFRYFQGKVDARLCAGDKVFAQLLENGKAQVKNVQLLNQDVSVIKEDIKHLDKRVEVLEVEHHS